MKQYEEFEDLDARRTKAKPPKRFRSGGTVFAALVLSLVLMLGNLSLYQGAPPYVLPLVWIAVFCVFYIFLRLLRRRT